MNPLKDFHGPNAAYILELYEQYQQNPNAVDAATRAYFEQWTPPANGQPALAVSAPEIGVDPAAIMGAVNLGQAIREYGHLAARLDPLGTPPPGDPALAEDYHGLTADLLRQLPASVIGGPAAARAANALEAVTALRRIYSTTIGYDYDHIREPAERQWLRHAAESRQFRPVYNSSQQIALLEQLTQVEAFERFLQRTFPGKTRFSIEGLDMMVPMLTEIIGAAADSKIRAFLIGMAHRGRLNVLAHVLRKPYAQILAEFKDPVARLVTVSQYLGFTGDVKYHAGALRAVRNGDENRLVVSMAPNPSHLEHVNPIVAGMARAAGSKVDQPGPPVFDPMLSLPVLIHGDASFPGQGIVAETLNMYRLPGYRVGGTIHLIANNQIGFTANPRASRSTLYASDLAKGFKIPVVHVNADDPEACLEVAMLAFAYQQEFSKDFVIDLIGYRRYGHNEGDEPRFTQPVIYQLVDKQPTVREQWGSALVERSVLQAGRPEALLQKQMDHLQDVLDALQPEEDLPEPNLEKPEPGLAKRVNTAVPAERLQALHRSLGALPDGFSPHPKLARTLKKQAEMLADPTERSIDWTTAEALALASILEEGIAIRLTGEDVERGTFSHRHAVLHHAETGRPFVPLQNLPQARAAFEIRNSPLSENAAVGFEYGYNIQEPSRLVLWEAQYGDFVNGAQAILDEFVVSGRAKWGQTPSLVLLLPHGFEGAGPDHSTGRLERFLESAAEINMRVANCTTAAQYFHLLRRQALLLETDPLPLIVFTPKSLLRHPLTASSLQELAEGRWQPVIDDAEAQQQPDKVEQLVLCSGKIYADLVSSEYRKDNPGVAIARIEQLYPLLPEALLPVLEGYPNLRRVVWAQEEPRNMGAWRQFKPQLQKLIAGRWPLIGVTRPRWSSPAEGSSAWHHANQKALVESVFKLDK
ncbi:MAG: 2-oxoglutarate dehydrogenase E1 component [Anaerolineae bacterium]|nr:2-oxoglutarate dehydrogenase E1 component [Anaerolineae bacterium]